MYCGGIRPAGTRICKRTGSLTPDSTSPVETWIHQTQSIYTVLTGLVVPITARSETKYTCPLHDLALYPLYPHSHPNCRVPAGCVSTCRKGETSFEAVEGNGNGPARTMLTTKLPKDLVL